MAIRRFVSSNITSGLKFGRTSDAVPATGGTVTYRDGYFIHTFIADGTFVAKKKVPK